MQPILTLLLSLILSPSLLQEEKADPLWIPSLLSDHMVLQQGKPVVLWGTARPGSWVTVTMGCTAQAAQVNGKGKWTASLPAQPATSQPQVIEIKSGNSVRKIQNVLVGEVWLCSGQSNMYWPVEASKDAREEIARANHPTLRMFSTQLASKEEPQRDVNGSWEICTPETVGSFSATAYYFGLRLQEKLGIPIGLIHTSWGGSTCEAWIRESTLNETPAGKPILEDFRAYRKAMSGSSANLSGPRVDDSEWQPVSLPGIFADFGFDIDGVAWFRKTIEIPKNWANRKLTLSLGPIDDRDVTWFQGTRIGSTNSWRKHRTYSIPARLVKPGPAVIAIRVTDNAGRGGFWGEGENLSLKPTKGSYKPISLASTWKTKVTSRTSARPAQHLPAHLYNGMIHPFIQYRLRGFTWYQGENNTQRPGQYREIFPMMIRDWRNAFGEKNLPFYFVQLANLETDLRQWDWPALRDAQLHTYKTVSNTGMAVAVDIGNPRDIHPRNKQEVGRRLALWALSDTYGKKGLVKSGPIFTRASFGKKGRVRIQFDTFGSALTLRGDETLGSFLLAGEDRVFHPAEAKIVKDQVVAWSPEVPHPVSVRYGWKGHVPEANLVNTEGLPASPFRTDSWPSVFD